MSMRTPGVTFPLMAAALLVLVCAGVADATNCSTYNQACTSPKMNEGSRKVCPNANCTDAVCCTGFRNCQLSGVACSTGFTTRADAASYVCPDATGCDNTQCCVSKPDKPDAACTDAFKDKCPAGKVPKKDETCDPNNSESCNEDKCCAPQCYADSCDKLSDANADCKIGDKGVCKAKCAWTKDTTPAQLDECVTCILANAGDKANTCYGNARPSAHAQTRAPAVPAHGSETRE
jgi:hypothetical protein